MTKVFIALLRWFMTWKKSANVDIENPLKSSVPNVMSGFDHMVLLAQTPRRDAITVFAGGGAKFIRPWPIVSKLIQRFYGLYKVTKRV